MSWEDDAACKGSPRPDAWFEVEDAAEAGRPADPEVVEYARAHCRSCPVRDACLARAPARWPGIWGGRTGVERRRDARGG